MLENNNKKRQQTRDELRRDSTRDRRLRLKPPLVQDTDYMVEKTDQIAPCLGLLGRVGKSVKNSTDTIFELKILAKKLQKYA